MIVCLKAGVTCDVVDYSLVVVGSTVDLPVRFWICAAANGVLCWRNKAADALRCMATVVPSSGGIRM